MSIIGDTLVDLFSRMNAFFYVFEKNGINCILSNDIEISSKKIYELNNPLIISQQWNIMSNTSHICCKCWTTFFSTSSYTFNLFV